MARVRNCISLLSQQNIRIDAESIMQAYELSLTYPAKQLLQPAAVEQIASQIY
jgi:hypothetical protein